MIWGPDYNFFGPDQKDVTLLMFENFEANLQKILNQDLTKPMTVSPRRAVLNPNQSKINWNSVDFTLVNYVSYYRIFEIWLFNTQIPSSTIKASF